MAKEALFICTFVLRKATLFEDEALHADPGGDETVLVAEDDENIRFLIAHVLRRKGMRCMKRRMQEKLLIAEKDGRKD